MTPRQIIKKWQKLFRIQHWDIELVFHKEYEDEELIATDGYVKMRVADLQATIVINKNSSEPMESIILHEMLHILVRNATVPLNALFHTEDAENVFSCVDELLVRRLEEAFITIGQEKQLPCWGVREGLEGGE